MANRNNRILRVAVVQDGRITEERLLRVTGKVTIGQSPRATLYVPRPGLPVRTTLFDVRRGRYRLRTSPQLSGRVFLDGRVRNIRDVARVARVVPLQEETRGRLVLGEVTILFQMVPPPPRLSRPCLPASARGGLGHALRSEVPVLAMLAGSLLLHVGLVGAAQLFHEPVPEPRFTAVGMVSPTLVTDVEWRKAVVEEEEMDVDPPRPEVASRPDEPDAVKPTEEVEPASEPTEVADTAPQPTPTAPSRTRKGTPGPDSKPERVAGTRRPPRTPPSVRDRTLLKFVTGFGKNGRGGIDTLARGHALNKEAAFGDHGVRVATSERDHKGFTGGPNPEAVPQPGPRAFRRQTDRTRLKTRRVTRAPDKDETRVKLRVRTRRPRGQAPQRTLVSLGQAIRKRSSAFRSCYEKRLRQLPNLKGKVVIALTLTGEGRVGMVRVSTNSTGDSVVAQCIVKKVKGWNLRAEGAPAMTRLTVPVVLTKDG